ncbi:hypothetical protein Fot_37974 [Forsythia ovata]|uniref:Uncharacterized protein n=1 Tax=Forsythia ovata TaxID=205694 RepID=A0ABD1S0I3_9LAMI
MASIMLALINGMWSHDFKTSLLKRVLDSILDLFQSNTLTLKKLCPSLSLERQQGIKFMKRRSIKTILIGLMTRRMAIKRTLLYTISQGKGNREEFSKKCTNDLTASIDISVLQERLTNMINLG